MIGQVIHATTELIATRGRANCRILRKTYVCLALLSLFLVSSLNPEESAVEEDSQETRNSGGSETETVVSEESEDDWEIDSDSDIAETGVLATLEEILEHEASAHDYEMTLNCLSSRRIRDYDVLSERFILVQMRDKETKYLIQLDRKCVGLTKGATLRFDSRRGSTLRVCTNDTVRATMATDWGPPCRLPGFEPVNEVQLEQLTRGLVSHRVE